MSNRANAGWELYAAQPKEVDHFISMLGTGAATPTKLDGGTSIDEGAKAAKGAKVGREMDRGPAAGPRSCCPAWPSLRAWGR